MRAYMAESLPSHPWNQFRRFSLLASLFGAFVLCIGLIYRSVLLSVVLSLILAYIFYPMIGWLESKSKLRRSSLVTILVGLLFGLLVTLAALFLPLLYEEILGIIKKMPTAIEYLRGYIEPLQFWLASRGYLSEEVFRHYIGDFSLTQELSKTTGNALRQVWMTTPLVLGGALNLVLIPIFSCFFLNYGKIFSSFILSLVPGDLQPLATLNTAKMNKILWGVIKGQVMVAAILAILYMAGFSIIGLQSGLAIGAIAGICRIVPYLDVVVGVLLSIVVIISQDGTFGMVLAVGIVIATVQAIDGMLITPRIIGERAGIHPVIVIASVISFGDWFGILGIVIAVPVVAIVSAAIQIALPYYRSSHFFSEILRMIAAF